MGTETVISHKNLRKPTTMHESFYILEEEEIINADMARKLAVMVGFRNVIAHDYDEINYDIVYDVLHNKLSDIRGFQDLVKKLLNL